MQLLSCHLSAIFRIEIFLPVWIRFISITTFDWCNFILNKLKVISFAWIRDNPKVNFRLGLILNRFGFNQIGHFDWKGLTIFFELGSNSCELKTAIGKNWTIISDECQIQSDWICYRCTDWEGSKRCFWLVSIGSEKYLECSRMRWNVGISSDCIWTYSKVCFEFS